MLDATGLFFLDEFELLSLVSPLLFDQRVIHGTGGLGALYGLSVFPHHLGLREKCSWPSAKGRGMSTGTSGRYWDEKALPSVLKHELLGRYLPPFGGMTSKQSVSKRVVYLDGYAGEGRYQSGEPGSAEIALRVAAHHRALGLCLSCFFVEEQASSFARLRHLVGGYRDHGVDAHAYHGMVDGVLDAVVREAVGLPLFLFLDPCGLCLPFERLVDVLARQRPHRRPATELLMNFSMMAVRRLGGHVTSPKGNKRTLERFDAVCGGSWWREYFAGRAGAGEHAQLEAAEAVAATWRQRLAQATGMYVQSVAVTDDPDHKPIYHLVFATRSPYGLWVFGDAVAGARNAWWETLERRQEDDGGLFPVASLQRPDPETLVSQAVPAMAANLEQVLLRQHRSIKLVDHTLDIFGDYYGQVTESAARAAVKYLYKQGKTTSNGVGRNVRELLVAPPRP